MIYRYVPITIRVIPHPAYDPDSYTNDIALIELSHPVDFAAHPHIRPVCWPSTPVADRGEALVKSDNTVIVC